MKRIYPLLLSLLFIAAAFGSEQQDPFKPQNNAEWHLESIKEKPYLLEVAYGEHEGRHPDMSSKLEKEVDPEFLEASTRLSIATSSNETGEFKESARHMVKYQISRNADGSFDLKIYIKTIEGGVREFNTDITLKESKWIVFSGLIQKSNREGQSLYTTAIRVAQRANKSQ